MAGEGRKAFRSLSRRSGRSEIRRGYSSGSRCGRPVGRETARKKYRYGSRCKSHIEIKSLTKSRRGRTPTTISTSGLHRLLQKNIEGDCG